MARTIEVKITGNEDALRRGFAHAARPLAARVLIDGIALGMLIGWLAGSSFWLTVAATVLLFIAEIERRIRRRRWQR